MLSFPLSTAFKLNSSLLYTPYTFFMQQSIENLCFFPLQDTFLMQLLARHSTGAPGEALSKVVFDSSCSLLKCRGGNTAALASLEFHSSPKIVQISQSCRSCPVIFIFAAQCLRKDGYFNGNVNSVAALSPGNSHIILS